MNVEETDLTTKDTKDTKKTKNTKIIWHGKTEKVERPKSKVGDLHIITHS